MEKHARMFPDFSQGRSDGQHTEKMIKSDTGNGRHKVDIARYGNCELNACIEVNGRALSLNETHRIRYGSLRTVVSRDADQSDNPKGSIRLSL